MNLFSDLRASFLLRGCKRVGARVRLDRAPWIDGRGDILLGDDVAICSLPVQTHLFAGPRALLRIGARVQIAQGVAISALECVAIGDDTQLGPFVTIADTDFHVAGDRNAAPETEPVQIGARVHIGARSTILRGAKIGDGAQIAAGSVVNGSIAAGSRVAGVPAREAHARIAAASSLSQRVISLVQRTLALDSAPALDAGPRDLPEWDSLGALKLLLALEEEFAITLREEILTRAQSVGALVDCVESALNPE